MEGVEVFDRSYFHRICMTFTGPTILFQEMTISKEFDMTKLHIYLCHAAPDPGESTATTG